MRIATVLLLGLLAGCSSHGGGSALPGSSPTDVVAEFATLCHQASGDIEIPFDVSPAAIQAFVPDGSPAGYRVVIGTAGPDHSIVLHDIPADATYVLQGSALPSFPRYYVTDQHALKLRSELQGRCMPSPAPASVPIDVAIDLTGSSGFNSQLDRLDLHSFKLGVGTSIADGVLGVTELQATIPWPKGFGLVDAAAGDDLYVVHSRADSRFDGPTGRLVLIQHILEWFDATGATLQDGKPASITGVFQSATSMPASSRAGTLSIDHARFEALYDSTTRPGDFTVQLMAQPGGGVGFGIVGAGSFGGSAMPVGVSVRPMADAQIAGTTTTSYDYVDPFPASWKRTLTIDYLRSHLVRLSSDPSAPLGVLVGYHQQIEYAGSIQVAPPALTPPTGITVGGVDFTRGGKVAFDGQSPVVISWNPVPGAQLYEFMMAHVAQDLVPLAEMTVTTAGTSLKLPAAMFEAGTRYQFVLKAIQTPADYRAGELIPASLPQVSAAVPSGRFRFLPSCGDGIVQPGEDCDTGGESATCNADCTTAMCGDGVINAAAGEQCDAINESLTCTPACKLQ